MRYNPVNIKFSKTQLKNIAQSGGNLGNILSKAIDWASKTLPTLSSLSSMIGLPKALTKGYRYVNSCFRCRRKQTIS